LGLALGAKIAELLLVKRVASAVFVIAIYALTIATFWGAGVHTITVYPYKDSYSWESVPYANNGGSRNFEITSYNRPPNNMRGWMAFNLSTLPQDVLVFAAKLSLRIWHKTTVDQRLGTGDATGRVYGVYRLTQPWGEYNVTWANQPAYTQEDHATAMVPSGQGGFEGPLLWMEWDLTEIVRDWLSGAPNHGILVKDMQENASTLYSTQFFTHDRLDENHFPRLLVTYVTPTSAAVLIAVLALETVFIFGLWRRNVSRGK